jgi:hypothetical protein
MTFVIAASQTARKSTVTVTGGEKPAEVSVTAQIAIIVEDIRTDKRTLTRVRRRKRNPRSDLFIFFLFEVGRGKYQRLKEKELKKLFVYVN